MEQLTGSRVVTFIPFLMHVEKEEELQAPPALQRALLRQGRRKRRTSVWRRLGRWRGARRRGYWSFMKKYRHGFGYRHRRSRGHMTRGHTSGGAASTERGRNLKRDFLGRRGRSFKTDVVPTRRQLDAELDQYMSLSRSRLDQELEEYMSRSRRRLDVELDQYMCLLEH